MLRPSLAIAASCTSTSMPLSPMLAGEPLRGTGAVGDEEAGFDRVVRGRAEAEEEAEDEEEEVVEGLEEREVEEEAVEAVEEGRLDMVGGEGWALALRGAKELDMPSAGIHTRLSRLLNVDACAERSCCVERADAIVRSRACTEKRLQLRCCATEVVRCAAGWSCQRVADECVL